MKCLVSSHLDYCDIIYHIPALNSQTNLGVTKDSSVHGRTTPKPRKKNEQADFISSIFHSKMNIFLNNIEL